jgi:heme-degrading monooxygenase HmoA
VGEAPKRVGIQEWESLEKAQAFRNSDAFKKLTPQRDKAVKTIRSYAVEAN